MTENATLSTTASDPETQRALRSALGSFATGVTVVTALAENGAPIGLTVNSFTSVSLDPPLALWCLGKVASDCEAFTRARHWAVHVLGADQAELSNRFASRTGDRFEGVAWRPGLGGVPVIENSLACFELAAEATYPGGDHVILLGRIERFAQQTGGEPLIFSKGRYRYLGCD